MSIESIITEQDRALLRYFNSFISEHKLDLFDKILKQRTRHLTVVLEDIFQPQNASAVLRTCDCTGVQDIHIVEERNVYNVNPEVAMGSTKWLNLHKYDNGENRILSAYEKLRKQGYRIVATTPHTNDCTLEELPLDQKTALVFGTELNGLTDTAIENADAYVRIPMYGFTESYNISVSAALTLYTLMAKLRNSNINWQLSEEDEFNIRLFWAKNSVKTPELHEKNFFERINNL